jgi:hypothetical protein
MHYAEQQLLRVFRHMSSEEGHTWQLDGGLTIATLRYNSALQTLPAGFVESVSSVRHPIRFIFTVQVSIPGFSQ